MELTGHGVKIQINPAELDDDQLIGLAQEISDVARERGLELPFATGVMAVEAAMQTDDRTEVSISKLKESFTEQLATASKGYKAIIDIFNCFRRKEVVLTEATNQAITAEFEEWLTEDKLVYVASALEADPHVRFTLVATPNVVVSSGDLARVAKVCGDNQPYDISVWDKLYKAYTSEQLSGTKPDNGNRVVFSLIPNSCNPAMEGDVGEQLEKLSNLQADYPGLKVPSLLEAVTYWQTLRAGGDYLADSTTFDRTYIRHFDLPEQCVDGWLGVLYSCVDVDGEPGLYYSYARCDSRARVAVG